MDSGASTDLKTVRGVLLECHDTCIVLGLPATDYRLHLKVLAPIQQEPGSPVRGSIEAEALRLDRTTAGGRFIEPVYGRPRRIQGRIVATDDPRNRVTVRCACLIHCRLGLSQQAADFTIGDLVTFDVKRGAMFVLAS